MKFSMMSYTMSRQPGFDLNRMFKLTLELKLEGLDMVTLYDRSAAELRRMADDYGVKIIAHTFMADLNGPDAAARRPGLDAVKRGIEAAVILGAPTVMIPSPSKDGLSAQESRTNWIAGLKEAMPVARQNGINLTVENFPGYASPFVTAADFLEAADEIPGLLLTYDNGNAGSGEDAAESFRRTEKYAIHAHFKDWDIVDNETAGYRLMRDGRWYRPALIGEGKIDQASCLKAMKKAGYDKFINIEYEGDKYPAEEGIRRAVNYLRSLEI